MQSCVNLVFIHSHGWTKLWLFWWVRKGKRHNEWEGMENVLAGARTVP